jgi:hypothetical protein
LELVPVLRAYSSAETPMLIGLALLATNDNDQPRVPRGELVRIISQCLLAAATLPQSHSKTHAQVRRKRVAFKCR